PGEAAQDGVVADVDVARDRGGVREDRVIADLAVVGDVHVSHEPVVAADARDARVLRGAAVERAELADGIAVSDLQAGRLARVLLVLGPAAQRAVREDAVVPADSRPSLDHDVRAYRRARADLDVLADDRVRADRHVRRKPRAGVNDRARVDHLGRSVQSSVASAASASPTLARAENFMSSRPMRSAFTSRSSWSPGMTGRLKRAPSTPTQY